ncbi:MAG: alpha/beta fold hydrolase [Acidobacteria bacterium]|nr:alpha/beta fold hydrolase [Acidobacteriota bacterium]
MSSHFFGPYQLNPRERSLRREGKVLQLAPKTFDLLCLLVESAGKALSKEKLLGQMWPDTFVEEANLTQHVSLLRKTLDDGVYIETVPKFGYRFCAIVRSTPAAVADATLQLAQSRPPAPSSPPSRQETTPETRYARNGGVNIAYQVLGDGPIDLVFVMGWVSHLEYFWTEPSFARFLRRLSSFSRLILFDKRGTGLSDRVPLDALPTLEQRMEDLHAVMDAVQCQKAALCGVSEGGPMSALFAATYPDRTLALTMIGTYARRLRDDDYPWGPTLEQRAAYLDEIERSWGGPVGIEDRAPSKANDPEFRNWWATYLRMGASPGAARALTKMNAEIDVRSVLPSVRVPSLIIHRTGDQCLKVEEGRYVASLVPNARYVEFPGDDHLPFVGNQDEIVDEMEEFLTGVRHGAEPERVLTTILFAAGADIGDPKLRTQLDREVQWFRGQPLPQSSQYPEARASFDGPARAIRCASALVEHARRSSLSIRVGLHTGECDKLPGGGLGGLAVEVGPLMLVQATANEVIVTGPVRDLVAGSGITFQPTEESVMDWRLFQVVRARS